MTKYPEHWTRARIEFEKGILDTSLFNSSERAVYFSGFGGIKIKDFWNRQDDVASSKAMAKEVISEVACEPLPKIKVRLRGPAAADAGSGAGAGAMFDDISEREWAARGMPRSAPAAKPRQPLRRPPVAYDCPEIGSAMREMSRDSSSGVVLSGTSKVVRP
jgi:hypothetical protein